MQIGICDCPVDQTGAICKHQIACADKFMLQLPQELQNTPASRQWLAGSALRRKPPLHYFTELHEKADEEVDSFVLAVKEEETSALKMEETSSSVLGVIQVEASIPASADEETLYCSALGNEVGTSGLTPKTDTTDLAGLMVRHQSSETSLDELVCLIKGFVEEYGDGEIDVAIKKKKNIETGQKAIILSVFFCHVFPRHEHGWWWVQKRKDYMSTNILLVKGGRGRRAYQKKHLKEKSLSANILRNLPTAIKYE